MNTLINNILKSILILLLCFTAYTNKIKLEKFDYQKWKKGTQIERGNMATHLVESKVLLEKNKTTILNLFGSSTNSTETNFHYLVDFGYMTPFHLDINFNINNEVENVTLTD